MRTHARTYARTCGSAHARTYACIASKGPPKVSNTCPRQPRQVIQRHDKARRGQPRDMLSHNLEVDIRKRGKDTKSLAERSQKSGARGTHIREAPVARTYVPSPDFCTRARTPALEPTRAMHQDHTMNSAGRTNVRTYVSTHPPKMSPPADSLPAYVQAVQYVSKR